ncbi:hypothetical protein [Sicyoidochytrium minutum DNA virus]|nr:hypothetical protein [Sicyoidochytrium minutum DNA virus]BDC16996.1 hypothetical protein [Sicyoidochytrium minutum DNA virus]
MVPEKNEEERHGNSGKEKDGIFFEWAGLRPQ